MSKMTNAAERCGRIRLPKVRAGELSKHLFMMLVVAAMFVPFIMMLSIALKDKKQIVYDFFSFSGPYHWENYKAAFSAISPYLFNTVFMAVCTTVLSAAQAAVWHNFHQDDAAGRCEFDSILHARDEAWNSRYLSACHSVRRGREHAVLGFRHANVYRHAAERPI